MTMRIPFFSTGNLVSLFMNNLYSGRAWNKRPDSNLTKLATAMMPVEQSVLAAAGAVMYDVRPDNAGMSLSDWERSLGLPDDCLGPNPSTAARRQQVIARFTDSGGQSKAHYIAFAKALGYDITIGETDVFRMGVDAIGVGALTGDEAIFNWTVNAPPARITYFEMGVSAMGDPLGEFGDAVLKCELLRISPAHTVMSIADARGNTVGHDFVVGTSLIGNS